MSHPHTHNHRPRVALHAPKHVPDYIKDVRAMSASMKQNQGSFPGCLPLLTQLDADVDDLEKAEVAVKTGTHGMADTRDQKKRVVELDVDHVLALVQQVIEKNAGQATELVAQAGLHLAKPTTHGPQPLEARPGKVSGEVTYVVPSAGGGAYEFQCSVDGGKTYPQCIVSDLAHATFPGLPVGTTAWLRYRHTHHGITGDWSQPISFVVR